MASITRKLLAKTNATKFARFLTSLPNGTTPPPITSSSKSLFKVMDLPKVSFHYDAKLGTMNARREAMKKLINIVFTENFLHPESMPEMEKWPNEKIEECISIAETLMVKEGVLPNDWKELLTDDEWKELLKREGFPLYQSNIEAAKPSKTNATKKVSNDGLEVFLEASGFHKHDLQISVQGNTMFIMGMAVTPLGTKLIHEAVEFYVEMFYDAHKVAADLSEGILKVKFPIGRKETMMAEPFSNKWK